MELGRVYLALGVGAWGVGLGIWLHLYFSAPLWVVVLFGVGFGVLGYYVPDVAFVLSDAVASVLVFMYYPILPAMFVPSLGSQINWFLLGSVVMLMIVFDVLALVLVSVYKGDWRRAMLGSAASMTAFINPMLSALMLLYVSDIPMVGLFVIPIIITAVIGNHVLEYMTPPQTGITLAPILYVNAWVYVLGVMVAVILMWRAYSESLSMSEQPRRIARLRAYYISSVAIATATSLALVGRYEATALLSAPFAALLYMEERRLEARSPTPLELYAKREAPVGKRIVDLDVLRLEGESILGFDDLKKELEEVARDFIRAFREGRTWGHAIMFTGPPGTGKTALAHYLAYLLHKYGRDAGVDFKVVRVEANDLLTAYWGETERRINELFAWAAMNNGIVIMDEIERVMWRRQQYVSDDYTPKVVATLGDALDNPLVRDKPFILIVTTNLPQLVDEMFKRPGRVFRVFHIPVLDDVRKNAVITAFEEKYGIKLTPDERSELRNNLVVGDDARFYFECRAIGRDHKYCLKYLESVSQLRKETQQLSPMIM